MNMELPNVPWKKVVIDLFYWKASTCLLIVDYYSRYIQISKLNGQSSKMILWVFARHGYFKKLYSTIDSHIYPVNTSNLQPNMVLPTQKAAHAIFEVIGKQKELRKPLRACLWMIYCSIPLYNGFSSSELLINRWLHTTWSILENQLQPSISEWSAVCEKETMKKANSKKLFDTRHRANSHSRSIASRTTSMNIGEER